MNIQNQTFKASVSASIVAAILVILFIQPLLTWSWDVFVSGSHITIKHLTDSIYRSAALGQRNWVVVLLLLPLSGIFTGIAAMSIIYSVIPRDKISKASATLKKISKSIRIISTGSNLLGIVCILFLMTSVYADLQLNTSFNQRLMVLRPHIETQTEQTLRADWALMKNRSDYLAIVANMDSIAASKSIKLPELLLK